MAIFNSYAKLPEGNMKFQIVWHFMAILWDIPQTHPHLPNFEWFNSTGSNANWSRAVHRKKRTILHSVEHDLKLIE